MDWEQFEYRISATELAKHLSEVLTRVNSEGQHIVVERNGEPVAEIIPYAKTATLDELLDELEKLPPGDEDKPDTKRKESSRRARATGH